MSTMRPYIQRRSSVSTAAGTIKASPDRRWAPSQPQLCAGQPGPLGQGLELGPDHFRVDLGGERRPRGEPAVRAGDHALAADQLRVLHDAVRYQLRMLDEV